MDASGDTQQCTLVKVGWLRLQSIVIKKRCSESTSSFVQAWDWHRLHR